MSNILTKFAKYKQKKRGSNYLLPNCDEAVFLKINLVLPLTQLVRESSKTWLLSSKAGGMRKGSTLSFY